MVTEFGGNADHLSDFIQPSVEAQESHLVCGATIWSWKSNCNGDEEGCDHFSWVVVNPAPAVNASQVGGARGVGFTQ